MCRVEGRNNHRHVWWPMAYNVYLFSGLSVDPDPLHNSLPVSAILSINRILQGYSSRNRFGSALVRWLADYPNIAP
jgi:hypothetical protein